MLEIVHSLLCSMIEQPAMFLLLISDIIPYSLKLSVCPDTCYNAY